MPMTYRLALLMCALFMLTACGAPSAAPTSVPAAAVPTASPTVAATDVPTASPTVAATDVPTASPTVAATDVPTASPTVAATASPTSVASAPGQRFRTVPSSDGFIAVRAQPTTRSAEVQRIPSGNEVVCAGTVPGERLTLLGVTSDQWANCPALGGYIFVPLLIDLSAAPALSTPAAVTSSDRDAIIAALRAYLGTGGPSYRIDDPCVDRDYALAVVVADQGGAEDGLALLQRTASGWQVLVVGPTMLILYPEEITRFGAPADFACLGDG
ncbi:MAG: hypothetical protein AB4911_05080 [Oscillochloridaceae bacterium umkhey_bin13]